MNVYIESNFILELALEQEQCSSCDAILSFAERGAIQLLLPAFSIAEPYETLMRRAKEREVLATTLAREIRQLARSKPYKDRMEALQHVTSLLVQSIEYERERVNSTLEKLLNTAETIALGQTILRAGASFQKTLGLSPQDAIIYASVLEHVQVSDSAHNCFLNRNSRDFDDPDIVETLDTYQCKMLFRFDHGYGYIKKHLNEP